jgi:hypothetical protein
MRITVIPGDDTACGRYRLTWPAQAAQQAGADITIIQDTSTTQTPDTDVLVIQRPMHPDVDRLLAGYHKRGIAVVVDIDDAFWTIDPRNVAFKRTHPKHTAHNTHNLARWCHGSELVTATTPAIANRYRGRHGSIVIPNRIPNSALQVGRATLQRDPDDPVVGWAGFVANHPDDLRVAAPIMRALERLTVIGDPREHTRIAHQLGVPVDRVEVTGPAPIDHYQHALGAFDIGLAPLADTAFNRAKSALKMLEYAAAGAHPIGSPTPDNQRLAHDGIGALVHNRRGWARALLDGQALTDARHQAWQQAALHTIEANIDQWLDAWATARTGGRVPA